MRVVRSFEKLIGRALAVILPEEAVKAVVIRSVERNPNVVLEAFGPLLNRGPNLDTMPFDLPVDGDLQFEHLSDLFASTSFDHAVISMPIRQTSYLFGLTRQMGARKVIEIGRYKGGSTITIAAAMKNAGAAQFWSVDIGEKEARLRGAQSSRSPYSIR